MIQNILNRNGKLYLKHYNLTRKWGRYLYKTKSGQIVGQNGRLYANNITEFYINPLDIDLELYDTDDIKKFKACCRLMEYTT